MTFAEGSKVVVHSLKKEGRLNGVKATIMHYSTERKRYAVLIEGESKGVMMLEKKCWPLSSVSLSIAEYRYVSQSRNNGQSCERIL